MYKKTIAATKNLRDFIEKRIVYIPQIRLAIREKLSDRLISTVYGQMLRIWTYLGEYLPVLFRKENYVIMGMFLDNDESFITFSSDYCSKCCFLSTFIFHFLRLRSLTSFSQNITISCVLLFQ